MLARMPPLAVKAIRPNQRPAMRHATPKANSTLVTTARSRKPLSANSTFSPGWNSLLAT
jgi:hypothetical protein